MRVPASTAIGSIAGGHDVEQQSGQRRHAVDQDSLGGLAVQGRDDAIHGCPGLTDDAAALPFLAAYAMYWPPLALKVAPVI
ncbi:hypothetical protein GCM10027277_49930 [Pseudoduganella ginsengisoli]